VLVSDELSQKRRITGIVPTPEHEMFTLKTFQEKLDTFYHHKVMIRNEDLMEMVKVRGIARIYRN
jgi:hypothetical protein